LVRKFQLPVLEENSFGFVRFLAITDVEWRKRDMLSIPLLHANSTGGWQSIAERSAHQATGLTAAN